MSHFEANFLDEADMMLLRSVLGAPSRQLAPLPTQASKRQTMGRRGTSSEVRSGRVPTSRLQRGAA